MFPVLRCATTLNIPHFFRHISLTLIQPYDKVPFVTIYINNRGACLMNHRNGFVIGAVLLAMMLSGCSGKKSDTADTTTTSGNKSSNVMLSGVAAAGNPLASASFTKQ